MQLKVLIITCLTTISSKHEAIKLDLYRESEHFQIFCTPADQEAAYHILQQSEEFFMQLTHDFQHHYSSKIILKIYPDLASLHHAIGWPSAPDWVIGQTKDHTDLRVSPQNHGSYHSYDSVMRAGKVGLATLFIADKYQHHQSIPRWLHQGCALYKGNLISRKKLNDLIKNMSIIPTLDQLESISKDDTLGFDAMHGFHISWSLVEFINIQWGWRTILALLEDYAAFEKILGISKKEFMHQWKQFLLSQTSSQ